MNVTSFIAFVCGITLLCILFNFKPTEAGWANTNYNGNVSINTYFSGGLHFMEDLNRTSTAINCNWGDCNLNVSKYTNPTDIWYSINTWDSSQVHWSSAAVLDYFKTVHGRNGLDGAGGPSTVLSEDGSTWLLAHKIHYGVDPNYFQWTGSEFIYGDGDGLLWSAPSLDIVAHEMARAINQYSGNLVESGESGAIVTSFGDITAAMVSYWLYGENNKTWMFGEDSYTPLVPGDALRYLNDPTLAANKNFTLNDDPDYYGDMYQGPLDNGGIHVNCGIANKAFYLLAKGGSHPHGGVTMTGIGIDAAFAIWYRTFSTLSPAYSFNFTSFRSQMLHATQDLYGGNSFQYNEVGIAWALCGVGSMPSVAATNFITNSGFESTLAPWNMSSSLGGAVYTQNGPTPHSGRGYMQLGINNNAAGQFFQAFSIPKNVVSANLTFWLWTTTTDVTNSVRDRLYVYLYNNLTMELLAQLTILSNMDVTSTYVQKSFNLNAYIGNPNLQVRFYSLCDPTNPTTFKIDDVLVSEILY